MTDNRIVTCLALVAVVLVVAGCSTRVRDAEGRPGFGDQLAAAPTIGVATVTVAPEVEGVFEPADQTDADEALYGALLATGRGLEVWHPVTVTTMGGEGLLADLAAEYSRLGRLRPDQVRPLAGPLDGCRFLALGRLTEDRVRTLAVDQEAGDPVARAEGQAEHGDPWAAIVSVERQARVTVEIFDLTSGESMWRAEATSRDKQLYEYEDAMGDDPAAYLQERLAAADGPVYLSRHGDSLKLPDLIVLMRRAFTEMAGKLPAAER